jgi:hypothetical protein
MLKCAKANGVSNPTLSEADPYDFDILPETAITDDGGDTYVAEAIHSFPTEYNFNLPYGVIHSCLEGDYETSDIAPGYQVTIAGLPK